MKRQGVFRTVEGKVNLSKGTEEGKVNLSKDTERKKELGDGTSSLLAFLIAVVIISGVVWCDVASDYTISHGEAEVFGITNIWKQ